MAKIEYLVVHHTASPKSWTREQIKNVHVNERGWRDIGYHYLIGVDKDGEAYGAKGRSQDGDDHLEPWEYGAHCKHSNAYSLGIATIGNWNEEEVPKVIWDHLVDLLVGLCVKHELSPYRAIRGHSEMPKTNTACPGLRLDMTRLRREVESHFPFDVLECKDD